MSLNRRQFAGTIAAPLLAQKKDAAPPARPNIVLILADDLAAWMLGCYGNQEIRTPNIDLLARGGTRFLDSFVVTPISSANRATLFTGRVPRQHGILDFLTDKPIEKPPQGQQAPPPSFANEIMIPDLLAGAGYNCAYFGKWHMGNDEKPGHGYKFTYTFKDGWSPYQNPTMYRNGEQVKESGYLTELITSAACGQMDQQKPGEPFFLTIAYPNPHMPYDGHPQKYYDLYKNTKFDTVGWEPPAQNALREKSLLKDTVGNIRKFAAGVTALDDQIPVLLKKLQERSLRDNTLIVFTASHGYLLGRHGLWSNGHASDPINMYEEVMATPMIWNWLGKVPPEATRPDLVSSYDFLPTLCDVAGVTPPANRNLYGRSYLPLAMGRPLPKGQSWPTTVFGHFRNTEMARDARFKLVLRNQGQGPNELCALRTDPREKVNQYENPQFLTVRDRLTAELAAWRKRTSS